MKTARDNRPEKFPAATVGVTGAIGSGKSVVCSAFSALGRKVIAADPLARELMETEPHLRDQLVTILGKAIFGADGRLDRKRVADRIFGDRRLRERVNAAVHPAVFRAIGSRIESLADAERRPYVVIEAALIYESGMDRMLHSVVVVDAPMEKRLARVLARDGATREEFLQREQAQMKAAEKISRADFVIRNSGSIDGLNDRVRFLDRLFLTLFTSTDVSS